MKKAKNVKMTTETIIRTMKKMMILIMIMINKTKITKTAPAWRLRIKQSR